jgi:hypothetical protein
LFILENVLIKKCTNFKSFKKDSKPQKTNLKTSKIRPAENKSRKTGKPEKKLDRKYPEPS